jgi:sugar O-acyltransferase (sialic acid O-acetyltransferase NeuD family)
LLAQMTPTVVHVAGTRSFAAEVIDFARDAGVRVVGLVEPDDGAATAEAVHGLQVARLGEVPAGASRAAIVGTGDADRREVVERLAAAGWHVVGLIHPRAHVAPSSTVDPTALVGPGVVVGARARIGAHTVLGRGALVGHHTEIGDFCSLGPGANVAGNVRVERDALIAMGAVVRDHVTVGAGSVVAMGAVVVGDVPAAAEVRGIPAR